MAASLVRNCSDKFWYLNVLKSFCKYKNAPNSALFHSSSHRHAIELKMPSLSPTMESGTIVNWHKKEGDTVNPGDVLCEIQTDKAVMAFENEEEGIMAKIIMGDDSKDVPVGSLIAVLAEHGEDWKKIQSSSSFSTPSISNNKEESSVSTAIISDAHHPPSGRQVLGPAVRNLLEKYGISPNEITGTGPRGMLLKGDVLSHIQKGKLTPVPIVTTKPAAISVTPPPVTLKPAASTSKTTQHKNLFDEQTFQDLDLSSMRRTIAKRLTQSKTGIAHAYSTINCKVDSLMNFRKKFKTEGVHFSVNDFIIKAVGTALSASPEVCVVWKGDQLINPSSIDVSVAVATSSGLITPIVTQVTSRGVQEIGNIVKDLADRARIGKLQLHEFQGGAFTISNLGMYGIAEFSAIINPPQCAILAVGGSRLVLGEDGKPVTMMNATLSYDGEAISPVAAANFMSLLQSLLETPQNLLLGQKL